MHGVKRTRLTPQAAETKRLKELSKIEAYVSLQEDVLARKKSEDYTPEALKQTTQILDLNPEFYTIWNYRRYIFLRGLFLTSEVDLGQRSPEQVVSLLTTDLRLTTSYLQVHPKVYWIWNHRKWCLENVPLGPAGSEKWRNEFWKNELRLIEMMLDADARNFHAWSYRRYVLASLPESFEPKHTPRDELRYTQKKIEANFSNFSAWHCRTKILGGLWADMADVEVQNQKDDEFELVRQALWTDPGDQSGWLYHRWLIGSEPAEAVLRREVESIRELHDAEPDSKWCMNALAYYLQMLARTPTTKAEEEKAVQDEARGLLLRLAEVDPDRKERYLDFANRQ